MSEYKAAVGVAVVTGIALALILAFLVLNYFPSENGSTTTSYVTTSVTTTFTTTQLEPSKSTTTTTSTAPNQQNNNNNNASPGGLDPGIQFRDYSPVNTLDEAQQKTLLFKIRVPPQSVLPAGYHLVGAAVTAVGSRAETSTIVGVVKGKGGEIRTWLDRGTLDHITKRHRTDFKNVLGISSDDDIARRVLSAAESPHISGVLTAKGDLYDVLMVENGKYIVIIRDVQGKIQTAFPTSNFKKLPKEVRELMFGWAEGS